MRHQASRAAALMLGVLIVGAAPARAATITFEDVVRAVGASGQVRPADEVRLRVTSQSGRAAGLQNPPAQSAESSGPQQQQADGAAVGGGAPAVANGSADPSLSQTGGGQVETIDLGDVTGTVCDCGELPAVIREGGGFPWWLFGGVPLICVSGICFNDDEPPPNGPPPPGPTPTPTPPPNPIPEPATLLLFGSGLLALGARARRRFGRKGLDTPDAAAEEV